ncbi:hypothetical protein ACQP2U_22645 [Nocardia sp. CA-084685]|uniref:hypothetical protein n=1 Tax=Nocardia sp. CA-084685 TaxID=3239970 RepID=UPI003D97EE36
MDLGVGNIDDWYQDRAHRGDLDPRYDFENDDVRDPIQFGELPQREWAIQPARPRCRTPTMASTSRQAYVRRWLTENPNGSNLTCRDSAHGSGFTAVTKKMVSDVAETCMVSQPGKNL